MKDGDSLLNQRQVCQPFQTLGTVPSGAPAFFRFGRSGVSDTAARLRRGVFRVLEELMMAIGSYIHRHNEDPTPFIWTAYASDILEKVKRARRT
jgi:hypothetical protein